MAIKVQFNPSTLKVLYNPSTGKLQTTKNEIPASCEYCTDTQPAWIDVTFSDFIDVSCCPEIGENSYAFENFASFFNGNTYRAFHDGYCEYSNVILDPIGIEKHYFNRTCSGEPSRETVLGNAEIYLTIGSSIVTIKIRLWKGLIPYPLFCANMSVDCDDINGIVENAITSCYSSNPPGLPAWCGLGKLHPCGSSGQITLTS